MFLFVSVVRIITTAGHFVASVTPQLVDSWGLAGKHDILSHGQAGWLSSSGDAGLVITFREHNRLVQLGWKRTFGVCGVRLFYVSCFVISRALCWGRQLGSVSSVAYTRMMTEGIMRYPCKEVTDDILLSCSDVYQTCRYSAAYIQRSGQHRDTVTIQDRVKIITRVQYKARVEYSWQYVDHYCIYVLLVNKVSCNCCLSRQ